MNILMLKIRRYDLIRIWVGEASEKGLGMEHVVF
jgi:hypothetical protein